MGSVVGAELVCETGPDYVFSFLVDLSFSQSVIIRAVLKERVRAGRNANC